MKKRMILLAGLLLLLAVPAAWGGRPKAKHVVLIAIDGWGAYSVPKADIPNIGALMRQGCYTLHERSVLPSSSAINWASMFMGVGTELHGYTQWGSRTPELPSRTVNARGISPTVFSLLREQRPAAESGCLFEWEGIKYLIDSAAVSHVEQVADYERREEELCRAAVEYIGSKRPALCAICFDQLDHTGHGEGHDTPAYYAKLQQIDGYVGRIVEAVKEAGMYDDTVFILTADHGGKGKGHGGATLPEMEIPFIICGKGIRRVGALAESVVQYDTAATIAHILGLRVPQAWTGRPVLAAFK